MMHNDSKAILDDILSRWHHWMRSKPLNGTDRLDDPTFRDAKSRSGYESADEVIDAMLENSTMQAVDFHVSGDSKGQGGLPEPYRSAIYVLARNCYAGRSVWISPRLKEDSRSPAEIVAIARTMLTEKLMQAGVM